MRKWKKQVITCLSSMMLLTAFSATSMAAGGVSPTKTRNENSYEYAYSRWAKPINSYLVNNGDGTLTRVEASGGSIIIEKYDENGVLKEAKTVKHELSAFGGFYAGEDYNFFVFGQSNSHQDDTKEVIRVVRYSKDWTRLDEASLEGANTTEPFDAGSLRMTQFGDMLYIRTCHKMYQSSDGLNHQSNLTFCVRISDMEITDQVSGVSNTSDGYVSHSFNQFIAASENLVAADHGDAYPRAVVLVKYVAAAGDEKFTDKKERVPLENGYYTTKICDYIEVLPIKGSIGANDTGVSLGGFVVSGSSYLTAGNSVAQDDSYDANGVRNIFVTSTPIDDFSAGATDVKWITNYTSKSTNVSNPHLVKINDDSNLLIYKANSKVNYIYLDGEGNKVGSVQTMEGSLSDCEPVVLDDESVIWYYTQNSVPTFCKIGADGKSSTFSASGGEEKKISLNAASKELKIDETFTLTVSDGSDTAPTATWTSSDDTVAKVDNSGKVTAVKEGKATITAKVDNAEAACEITVVKSQKEITLNAVTHEMKTDETFQLEVTDGSNTALKATWTSSDKTIATVDDNGKVTAVKEGKVTITAKVDNATAVCVVTITKEQKKITLNATAQEIEVGETFQLKVTDGSKATWTSSDKNIATVNENGQVKAVKAGKATITAKADGAEATCTITVTEPETPKEITLNYASYDMDTKETLKLEAKTSGFDSAPEITWTSSDSKIAAVDKNGTVKPVKEGKVTITAKAGEVKAECVVTIEKPDENPDKIKLNHSSYELEVGETVKLEVVMKASSSNANRKIEWTSTDSSIAEVDDEGIVTAVKAGSVRIKATLGDSIVACRITVKAKAEDKPESISLNYSSHEVKAGNTLQLQATAKIGDSSEKVNADEIEWSSSDASIAAVDEKGLVKAVKKGTATITAKLDDLSASCKITVTEEAEDKPESISLNYSSREIKAGNTLQLQVTAKVGNSSEKVDADEIEWSSSDTSIAAVDEKGLVKAVKKGTATITAKLDDLSASCKITVTEEAEDKPESISLNYSSREVKAGNTLQLQVTAKVGNSSEKVDADKIEWSSSDTSIAAVDEKGLVKAVKKGTATITAKLDDLSASCKITVTSSSSSSGSSGGSSSSSGSSGRSKSNDTQKTNSSRPSYVVQGSWSQSADGSWGFKDSNGRPYRNSWGAVVNPYANTAAGQSDFDWFFFDENGKMRTGWFVDVDGNTYYLNEASDGTRGRMMTGWCWIMDAMGVQRCYYLNPISDGTKGKLLVNIVIDGYTINERGEWTVNGIVQTK